MNILNLSLIVFTADGKCLKTKLEFPKTCVAINFSGNEISKCIDILRSVEFCGSLLK